MQKGRAQPVEPFKRISAAEAKAMIDKSKVKVVDVREMNEYVEKHIPGVKLIPVNDLYTRVHELGEDKNQHIIFTCAVGVRSALAAELAAAFGYKNLYNLEGGTDAWVASKYPISTGNNP